MRAWLCDRFGPPAVLRLAERDDAPPGFGQVQVAVHHAALNYPDLLSIAGTYPIPSVPPFVPGVEGAGQVVACGPGVTRLRVGDRVCWQDNTVKGSFAEQVTLSHLAVAKVPDGVPTAVAAAVPTAFGTAWFALTHRAALQPGETLVVHGASGGVGLACVQLGKRLGATVIATGADDAKLAVVAASGADHVVNTGTGTVREQLLALTAGRGADVVCDPVGGGMFDVSMRAIAPLGRILVIGFTSGVFPVARANILLVKAISVIGANYGQFLQTEPETSREAIEGMLRMIGDGRLVPRIDRVLPLEQCVQGLELLAARRVVGKCVLAVQEPGTRA